MSAHKDKKLEERILILEKLGLSKGIHVIDVELPTLPDKPTFARAYVKQISADNGIEYVFDIKTVVSTKTFEPVEYNGTARKIISSTVSRCGYDQAFGGYEIERVKGSTWKVSFQN